MQQYLMTTLKLTKDMTIVSWKTEDPLWWFYTVKEMLTIMTIKSVFQSQLWVSSCCWRLLEGSQGLAEAASPGGQRSLQWQVHNSDRGSGASQWGWIWGGRLLNVLLVTIRLTDHANHIFYIRNVYFMSYKTFLIHWTLDKWHVGNKQNLTPPPPSYYYCLRLLKCNQVCPSVSFLFPHFGHSSAGGHCLLGP